MKVIESDIDSFERKEEIYVNIIMQYEEINFKE